MDKKGKSGGARKGAGRKPLPDKEKKVTIVIYPRRKYVDGWGGEDKLKEILLQKAESSKPK